MSDNKASGNGSNHENDGNETDHEDELETTSPRNHLRTLTPVTEQSERKDLEFLAKNGLIERTFAFGYQKHKYTHDTLTYAIQKLNKGNLLVITVSDMAI